MSEAGSSRDLYPTPAEAAALEKSSREEKRAAGGGYDEMVKSFNRTLGRASMRLGKTAKSDLDLKKKEMKTAKASFQAALESSIRSAGLVKSPGKRARVDAPDLSDSSPDEKKASK